MAKATTPVESAPVKATPVVTIEDYVAPEKAAHEYAPLVTSLINAGEGKVAAVTLADEDEAGAFLRAIQRAAGEQNVSAMKVGTFETMEDGVIVRVRIRAKITRTRTVKDAADSE